MKLRVCTTITAPDDATHYAGSLLNAPMFYRHKNWQWDYYNDFLGRWEMFSDMEPSGIIRINEKDIVK